jgi:hypothetical protein
MEFERIYEVLCADVLVKYCCAAQFLSGSPGRSPVDTSYWGNTGELTHIHIVYNITKNITCIGMSNYTRVQHIWNFTITNPNINQKPSRAQIETSSEHGQLHSHEHTSHRSTPNSASRRPRLPALSSCPMCSTLLTLNRSLPLLHFSQSQSYFATDSQSVSTSWCRARFGTFDQR